MSSSIVTTPRRRAGKVAGVLAAIVGIPLAIALVIYLVVAGGGLTPSPASVTGPPVRVTTAQGDRVYVLTSQWKTYKSFRNRSSYTDLLIDLWAFDAADAKPIWRHRLAKERRGVNMGRAILGAQAGVLWIVQPSGLVGLSLADGSVAADAARIEAVNPPLRGLVPTEERYFRFDAGGLSFTAADGRSWRLAGPDLKVAPLTPAPAKLAPGVALPADTAGGNSTWVFMERGLLLRDRWLGLLDDAEAETFRANGAIGGIDPANHPRTRLWSARVGSKQTFFGPRSTFGDFKPLPEAPEFLNAGLLSNGETHAFPIVAFKPDSLFVLHFDRLGEAGRLKLTRVSGPLGKVVWTVDLPVQRLESVMPGDASIVLQGRRDEPGPKGGIDAGRAVSVDQLIAVDIATGRMGVYGFKVKPTEPDDIPPSSTELGAEKGG